MKKKKVKIYIDGRKVFAGEMDYCFVEQERGISKTPGIQHPLSPKGIDHNNNFRLTCLGWNGGCGYEGPLDYDQTNMVTKRSRMILEDGKRINLNMGENQ